MARGTKYSTAEDLRLARAIVAAARSQSDDNVKLFWMDVYSHFAALGKQIRAADMRSPSGVEQHWHSVADNMRRFAKIHEAVVTTSVDEEDAMAMACTKYVQDSGRVFKHLEVWQYLRDEAPLSYKALLTGHPRFPVADASTPIEKLVTDRAPENALPTPAPVQEPSRTSDATSTPMEETPVATSSRASSNTTATKKRKAIDYPAAMLAQRQRKNDLLAQHNELLRQLVDAQSTMAHVAAFAQAPADEREQAAALQRRVMLARLEKEAKALGLDVASSNR
ncbi:hypothetical protein SPRG_14727 [Saprolegnia parasitica CBS 223.65]|uniref:No apical meristem-associated C-terminal domain-containing protein n=1 Tax=Saprolegnia parasitica (strain CBS 223.65) TaxID=695850 RepID=A0A067BN15_SAPPC|nr:hypothetical protein SPRG_14727 [Saprolegnia parasitica CBS 223.65]KDO19884.1 hypothetical protein SPRG_14727 [Saprolegnia parasitica CBS 223.65]|eukprot:XP_012209386.1 hypothetical protein SPRG_14727 [Saprolegnia parasitica CBS 223.65]